MSDGKSRWLIAVACMAVAVLLRWPTFSTEIWSLDEANTSIFASEIRDGAVLYRDAVDTRTPLLIYLLAAGMSVYGEWNLPNQHIAQALLIGLAAALLWRIPHRLGARGVGAWAAACFTLLTVIFVEPVDTFAITPEWLVALFSGVGFWLLARTWSEPRTSLALAAGASFGLSYLAKQPGLFDLIAALTWLAIFAAFDPARRRQRLGQAAGVLGGFVAVVAACWLYFAAAGAFRDYFYYTQTYSTRYYLPEVSTLDRLISLRMPFRLAWENSRYLAIGGGLGLLLAGWQLLRGLRSRLAGQELALLALGWTVAGVLGSGLSGREYGHYALQVIPGFSLLAGIALHAIWARASSSGLPVALVLRGLAVLPLVLSAVQAGRRLTALPRFFDSAKPVGELVRANTTPGEKIYTWGFYPEINFHAQRLSASRFIGTNFLTGLIPWTNLAFERDTTYAIVPGAWDQLWQDFEKHPPAAFIETLNRGYLKYPLSGETRLWEYLHRHYLEIGADIAHQQGCKVYRRTGASLPGTGASFDISLALKEGNNGSLNASLPPDTRAAAFLINGQSTGAVVFTPAGTRQLTYNYVAALHGPNPAIAIRVQRADGTIADGPVWQLNSARLFDAPAIKVGGAKIQPRERVAPLGIAWLTDRLEFLTNTPTRLVYDRPAALQAMSFKFTIEPRAFAADQRPRTDGVEVFVDFIPTNGKPQRLLSKRLNPVAVGADQSTQNFRVAFPEKQPGRIVFLITPGPHGNPDCDWSYVSDFAGEALPATLTYRDNGRLAVDFDLPLGIALARVDEQLVSFVHTPATLAFDLDPGMNTITGKFGALDTSWNNPEGHSPGIDYIIEQVAPDGRTNELWRQTLAPYSVTADRGMHRFEVKLAAPVAGQVRFRAVPTNPNNNNYGYAYWADLTATSAP